MHPLDKSTEMATNFSALVQIFNFLPKNVFLNPVYTSVFVIDNLFCGLQDIVLLSSNFRT